MENDKQISSRNRWVARLCWACYLLAVIWPGSWWGLHHVALMPGPWTFLALLIALVLIELPPTQTDRLHLCISRLTSSVPRPGWLIGGLAITAMFLFYQCAMHDSLYGDAPLFKDRMGLRTTSYDAKYLKELLALNFFDLKSGNTTVLSAVRLTSYWTGLTHTQVFRWLGSLSGGLYVWLWLSYVWKYLPGTRLRAGIALMGASAPFLQFFFGYEEIYAPVLLCLTAYLLWLLKYLQKPSMDVLIILIILLLCCLKLHGSSLILIPSALLAVYDGRRRVSTDSSPSISWRHLITRVMLPLTAGGLFVYLFVLGDHQDARFLAPDMDAYERLFLPIIPPDPPLDRYTLFHLNHFFDYFNMFFLWSGAALFFLMVVGLNYRHAIRWEAMPVKIMASTLYFYLLLFFAYNPLMSMPMDVDLFSLPGPVLIVTVLALAGQWRGRQPSMLLGPILALCLLALPVFWVNSDRQMLSHRLEKIGKHVFKTYWIRSAGDIHAGLDLVQDDSIQYLTRYLDVARELGPYALRGGDIEYANLLWKIARHYRTREKNYEEALRYHELARTFDASLAANYVGLMESHYFLRDYRAAYEHSLTLIELQYPTHKQAMRIAIDCGIQAGLRPELLKLTDQYLERWQDEDIVALNRELRVLLQDTLDDQDANP